MGLGEYGVEIRAGFWGLEHDVVIWRAGVGEHRFKVQECFAGEDITLCDLLEDADAFSSYV